MDRTLPTDLLVQPIQERAPSSSMMSHRNERSGADPPRVPLQAPLRGEVDQHEIDLAVSVVDATEVVERIELGRIEWLDTPHLQVIDVAVAVLVERQVEGVWMPLRRPTIGVLAGEPLRDPRGVSTLALAMDAHQVPAGILGQDHTARDPGQHVSGDRVTCNADLLVLLGQARSP